MGPTAQSFFRSWTKGRVAMAAVLLALIGSLVVLVMRVGLMEAAESMVVSLRETGPVTFFVAMALLPAVGFPMIAFTVAVGPVFGPTLGTGWVMVCSLAAVVVNLLLTYWLANRALRPLVSRLLTYFEVRLPEKTAGGAWPLTLIVRLAPGPPFWLQSYFLGLIRVGLVPYLVVSTLVMAGYIFALVLGGAAIAEGNGRLAVTAAGVLVIVVAGLQLLRKWIDRRRTSAALLLNTDLIVPAEKI